MRGVFQHALHTLGVVRRHAHILGHTCHNLGIGTQVHTQMTHNITTNNHSRSSTDRVRGIPYRHLGRQLRWVNPMGQHTCTRRITQTLEILVQDDRDTHQQNQHIDHLRALGHTCNCVAQVVTATERNICRRAQQQTDSHHRAGADLIDHKTIDKARKSIDERADTDDDTETCIRNAVFGCQSGHCEREILAHEVIDGIADHRHDDRT